MPLMTGIPNAEGAVGHIEINLEGNGSTLETAYIKVSCKLLLTKLRQRRAFSASIHHIPNSSLCTDFIKYL